MSASVLASVSIARRTTGAVAMPWARLSAPLASLSSTPPSLSKPCSVGSSGVARSVSTIATAPAMIEPIRIGTRMSRLAGGGIDGVATSVGPSFQSTVCSFCERTTSERRSTISPDSIPSS
jgi:hypothetical protein